MVLFSNGFEEGDFSAWTYVSGSPSVVTSPIHHGTYAGKFNAGSQFVYKQITAIGTVFARCYFQTSALPTWSNPSILTIYNTDDWVIVADARLVKDGSNVVFQLAYRNSASATITVNSATLCATNTWYCVELYWNKNTVGGAVLYVDDSSVATAGAGTTADKNANWIIVGSRVNDESATNHIDCVVVADAYIGPEATSSYSPKTRSSLPNTMMTLLNSKILYS